MATWCDNLLIVTGEQALLDEFMNAAAAPPSEQEKARLIAERERMTVNWAPPFAVVQKFAQQKRDAGDLLGAAGYEVEMAALRLEVEAPTPEQYAALSEEKPFMTPLAELLEAGTWDEILDAAAASRARSVSALEERLREKRQEIGEEYFDEDGIQVRWLSLAALYPVDDPGDGNKTFVQNDLWGTPRESHYPGEREVGNGQVRYQFTTDYTPPGPWLMAVAEKFPQLSFRMGGLNMEDMLAVALTLDAGAKPMGGIFSRADFNSEHEWLEAAGGMFAGSALQELHEITAHRIAEIESGEA